MLTRLVNRLVRFSSLHHITRQNVFTTGQGLLVLAGTLPVTSGHNMPRLPKSVVSGFSPPDGCCVVSACGRFFGPALLFVGLFFPHACVGSVIRDPTGVTNACPSRCYPQGSDTLTASSSPTLAGFTFPAAAALWLMAMTLTLGTLLV